MSLSTCLKKAGRAINAGDKAAVLSKAAEYRKGGLSANEAAIKAANDVLAQVQAELTALTRIAPKVEREATPVQNDDDAPATAEKIEGGDTAPVRDAKTIAREIAKARPDDDVAEVREAARKAIKEELGQKALDSMGQGSMMTSDELTQMVNEGQYEAVRDFAAAMPVPVRESDIPMETAVRAYSGTSHVPERRASSAQRGYVTAMADAWKRAERAAGNDPEALARVTDAMESLVSGYRQRYLASLASHSRVMSTNITGAGNFPVRRNQKRSEAADKKATEADDFLKLGIARMLKAAKAPIDNSPDSELARVKANLEDRERRQTMMKAANAALRKGDDAALTALGLSDERIAELKKPDFAGRTGFPDYSLTNNNAEIRRLRERLSSAEQRVEQAAAGPVEREYAGARIEENAQDDRLRLFFDGKPDEAVRTDLKANGFRWSPNAGAWQRQLTNNARAAAKSVLDKHFGADAPSLKRSDPRSGMPPGNLRESLSDQLSRLSIPYQIHDSVEDARIATKLDIPSGAKGMHFRGKIHLFAGSIRNTLEGEFVLWHEASHAGLNEVYGRGQEYEQALRAIAAQNKQIRERAKRWMDSYGQEDYQARIEAGATPERAMLRTKLQAIDEALSDMAGENAQISGLKRFIAKVQEVMRALGLNELADWIEQQSDATALAMILNARNAVTGKVKPGRQGEMQPAFSEDEAAMMRGSEKRQSPEWFGSAGLQLPSEYRPTKGSQEEIVAPNAEARNPATDEDGPTYSSGTTEPMASRKDVLRGTVDEARAQGFTLKAYRGISLSKPFNDTGTTWLSTNREVAETYAEEVMGYDDPGVIEVMVKPDGLQRHDASRLTDEQRAELKADSFGNPQAVGIYERSDDHPLGSSRRVTVIHAPKEAVFLLDDGATTTGQGSDSAMEAMLKQRAEKPAFSRASTAPEYLKAAREAVANSITAPGTLNWWHRSIGTPYNLAQRSPMFKRVFDRVQDFLGDVSAFATEAADKAPTILPKLESWKDIAKTALTAADTKAVGRPVFEGTLAWTRGEDGKPVQVADLERDGEMLSAAAKAQRLLRSGKISENVLKMWQGLPVEQYEMAIGSRYASQMLKAGIVWTDAELKAMFGLDKAQIALYREFRAATDESIKRLAVTDMLRYAGEDAAFIREEVLNAGTAQEAATLLRDQLLEIAKDFPERAEGLTKTANSMIDKADRANQLMAEGYAPLMRFGQYTVDVLDVTGERVYFGLFESKIEAARMAQKMAADYHQSTVTRGTVSQEEYKLFAGVSPETLELFGEMLGLESTGDAAKDKAFQEYIKLAKSNRSSMRRLIHRKGTAGFSEDVGRVLAGFVYSNARQSAANLHMGEITDAANAIPKGEGQLKDAAVKLGDYVKNPQEEAQAVRGLLFAQYLGGSVAAAMVNMTQPIQVTMPYLSQFGGIAQSAMQMKNAVADVWKKSTGEADLDKALKHAAEQGIVAPQEVHQLMAQASGRGSLKAGDGTRVGNLAAMGNNAAARLALAWGKFFSSAELFNRRVTFIAAYRVAKAQGMANPAEFAEKTINETQFIYNKGNRPQWARGALGGTLFTFKTYSISYVELLHRMYYQGGPEGRKAALFGLAMLMLVGGAGGLPFMEDVSDVIDGIGQRMGYNFSVKRARQQLLQDVLGKQLGEFMDKGISGLPGAPLDVSGRLGMGNLIPGTGIFTKKTDHTRDVIEIIGPAGDFAKRVATGIDEAASGKPGKGVLTASPTAARNLAKAWEMATTGQYKDTKGRNVLAVDGIDAVIKGVGFQPNDVARVQEASRDAQILVNVARMRESEIVADWAQAMVDGDREGQQAARDAIRQWNADNPDTPIVVKLQQVLKKVQNMRMSKADRIEKSAPKEVRAAARREMEQAR